MKFKEILKRIFSIKNDGQHKIITIMNIKFSFLTVKLLKKQIKHLETEIKILEHDCNSLNQEICSLNQEICNLNQEKESYMTWNFNPLGWCNEKLTYAKKGTDNVRLCTLELAMREVQNKNNMQGAIAELGVYQGDFASKISEFFPKNRFYLFDTFEGFNSQDKKIEKENNYSEIDEDYSDTTEEIVLSKINNPDRCVIKKGYFPDTLNNDSLLDTEQFIFVSIDADLYQPTIEGLKYFYPRLKTGGYIFVHDFNHSNYRGVKEAVYEYISANNIQYVPIPDISGSIVITK